MIKVFNHKAPESRYIVPFPDRECVQKNVPCDTHYLLLTNRVRGPNWENILPEVFLVRSERSDSFGP